MIFRDDILEGQVAVVTGGGTGLGFAIARQLAATGAQVVIASRNPDHLDDAIERMEGLSERLSATTVNVRDPASVQAMVKEVERRHERIDLLVNNAAGNFYAPSATLSPNGWRAVVETDLYGTFFCSQAVYPVMKAQGGGRIISISMTLHYRGWPLMAHATAAKAGIDALSRTLAREWGTDNILVNVIAPGPIVTEGVKEAFKGPRNASPGTADVPTFDDRIERASAVERAGTPDDIASMAAYLASPAAAWITGATFVVDGGSSLVGW